MRTKRTLVCNDCKEYGAAPTQMQCVDCRERSRGKHLITRPAGTLLCLCGCGERAQTVYLTARCYQREYLRRKRKRVPSLLHACPLWYGEKPPERPQKPAEKPIAYVDEDIAGLPVDDLFTWELVRALHDVQGLPLISDGMTT